MIVKKLAALLLLMAFVLGAFSGCGDNTEDVLGMVGETPIYRWYYNAYLLDQLESYEKNVGIDLTKPSLSTELDKYKKFRLEDLVGTFALYEEARVRGLTELTSEQEAEVTQRYNEYYDQYMESLLKQYGSDEQGRKKAEQAYMDILESRTLTPERFRTSMRIGYIIELLTAEITEETVVSDADVRAYYDENLAKEQAAYTENPASFGESVSDASIFTPEGYVETVRITVKFNSEQTRRLAEAIYARDALVQAQVNAAVSGDTTDYGEQLTEATANLDQIYEECYAELLPRMEEIRNEVLNGADFIKTMEEKSEDTRLISYYISADSTHVDESYKAAALALSTVGEISPAVRIENGLCIIQLKEKMASGIRSYEEAYESLKADMIRRAVFTESQKINDEYTNKAYEADIVELYYDKLP